MGGGGYAICHWRIGKVFDHLEINLHHSYNNIGDLKLSQNGTHLVLLAKIKFFQGLPV